MRTRQHDTSLSAISGAIMIIGMGVLFLVDSIDFWPWVLTVIALASLPNGIARGGPVGGSLAAGWLIALTVLIATGTLWPGILVLIGASVLLSMIVRSRR